MIIVVVFGIIMAIISSIAVIIIVNINIISMTVIITNNVIVIVVVIIAFATVITVNFVITRFSYSSPSLSSPSSPALLILDHLLSSSFSLNSAEKNVYL